MMAKRDWHKGWELCERATPGPWLEDELDEMGMLIWDAKFTVMAREALPCWLQRVRELEAKVTVLAKAVREYKETVVGFIYCLRADWKNKDEQMDVINS